MAPRSGLPALKMTGLHSIVNHGEAASGDRESLFIVFAFQIYMNIV